MAIFSHIFGYFVQEKQLSCLIQADSVTVDETNENGKTPHGTFRYVLRLSFFRSCGNFRSPFLSNFSRKLIFLKSFFYDVAVDVAL